MDDKKVFKKKYLLISIVVALLVLVGLVAAGYLSVLWKQPQQKVVLVSTVCGEDIISKYNSVSQLEQKGDDFSIDEAGFMKLIAEIKAKNNYQNDATCQMILLSYAIHKEDYKAAKEALSAVKALNAKLVFVNSKLNIGGSISAYEGFVQQLAPSNQNDQEPKGGA